ncbi:hypothetical protein [Photobacterium kishitanii]|uniref:Uncharacterized protein n=1 Tax=Photobacterium kishitanii TaxID=318456 RepID=A0A2T3KM81_9GAMM|nr:hypothetical protein [Photobacterium kishitanii]PSV00855.1 hypothetical protein C9J27_02180 [Photobacterium kishitanii]
MNKNFKLLVGDESRANYFIQIDLTSDVDLRKNKYRSDLLEIITEIHRLKSKFSAVNLVKNFNEKHGSSVLFTNLEFSPFDDKKISVLKREYNTFVSYEDGGSNSCFGIVLSTDEDANWFDIVHLMKSLYLVAEPSSIPKLFSESPLLLGKLSSTTFPLFSKNDLVVRRAD